MFQQPQNTPELAGTAYSFICVFGFKLSTFLMRIRRLADGRDGFKRFQKPCRAFFLLDEIKTALESVVIVDVLGWKNTFNKHTDSYSTCTIHIQHFSFKLGVFKQRSLHLLAPCLCFFCSALKALSAGWQQRKLSNIPLLCRARIGFFGAAETASWVNFWTPRGKPQLAVGSIFPSTKPVFFRNSQTLKSYQFLVF